MDNVKGSYYEKDVSIKDLPFTPTNQALTTETSSLFLGIRRVNPTTPSPTTPHFRPPTDFLYENQVKHNSDDLCTCVLGPSRVEGRLLGTAESLDGF